MSRRALASRAGLVLAAVGVVACSADGGQTTASTASTVPATGVWSTEPSTLRARSAHAVVVADGAIFALAGTDEDGDPLLDVERFDGTNWSVATQLPGKGVNAPSVAAVDGHIYLIGGFATTSSRPVDEVHVYEPATSTWTTAAPLPTASGGHAAVVLDGLIHVVGGGTSQSTIADHVVYDPTTDSWATAAPLPQPEGSPALAVLDGRLWAIGGRSGRSDYGDVYIYDPQTDEWTAGPAISPRGTAGAVTFCDTIFLIGGESQADKAVIGDTLRLDGDRWIEQAALPTPRSFARTVVFDDAIYVVAGSSTYGLSHASPGGTSVDRFDPVCD
ncbi:MAG: hypothetical protein K8R99_06650 [Actinomycetia bacterium]|nr:hypothetical protein [Actinomycetes bacterium]